MPDCHSDEDCADGAGCHDGRCDMVCVTDEYCADDSRCVDGNCIKKSGGDECTLSGCSDGTFNYSCADGSATQSFEYCSNGTVERAVTKFGNGHKVECDLNCSSSSGKCSDDTGAFCQF